jgi:hypothetical protein
MVPCYSGRLDSDKDFVSSHGQCRNCSAVGKCGSQVWGIVEKVWSFFLQLHRNELVIRGGLPPCHFVFRFD